MSQGFSPPKEIFFPLFRPFFI